MCIKIDVNKSYIEPNLPSCCTLQEAPSVSTHRLDVLSLFREDRLVVDRPRSDPRLDLVPQPLKLLDLLLEVLLVLLLLVGVRRVPHLGEVLLELLGALHHLF